MNSKMTTNSQLSTTEVFVQWMLPCLKQKHVQSKNKNKLSKQLEQEQNHRNGDHVEGYQWGSGRERVGKGTENK